MEDDKPEPESQEPEAKEAPEEQAKQEEEPEAATKAISQPVETNKDKEHEKKKRFDIKRWLRTYWAKKKLTIPLTVLVIIAILFIIPPTRYDILGLYVKENYTISLNDSVTHTPISGASILIGSNKVTTNGDGKATIKLSVGKKTAVITKQYYKSQNIDFFVSVSDSKDNKNVQLVATGRQVAIKVVNLITGKGVANADIKVLDTEAKTNGKGLATITLPVAQKLIPASISAKGYNDTNAKVEVTSQVVAANTFSITPAGKIYFLSDLTGTLDVDRTNLDGSGRQVVLAGTGNESTSKTVLLASRDWQYLALLAQRTSTGQPELDLITTNNEQMTNIYKGNYTITPVGWDDDYFIFTVQNLGITGPTPGQYELDSFNAQTKHITVLDQSAAIGTANNYGYQSFDNVYILSNQIVYTKNWNAGGNASTNTTLANQSATLSSVNPDGSDKASIKSFSTSNPDYQLYLETSYPDVDVINIDFYDGNQDNYYVYKDGKVSADPSLSDDDFYNSSLPTYLLSPGSDKTFWSVPRDGQNTLFTGDQYGNNPTQIATLSPYTAYGWYTDQYVLVSQNGSELYVMPATGGKAIKVTDYNKPAQVIYGYGGGYGGL